jgi:fluoroacetyl-CoA thioesterase
MAIELSQLKPGLTGAAELLVSIEHTAPSIGSGLVPVLGTPVMINVIKAAALAAVEPLLPAKHQSLGIHLDVRHFAATPIGMRVRATAELVGVDGRTLTFRVEARDDKEPIGDGSHQRVVVTGKRVRRPRFRRIGPDADGALFVLPCDWPPHYETQKSIARCRLRRVDPAGWLLLISPQEPAVPGTICAAWRIHRLRRVDRACRGPRT